MRHRTPPERLTEGEILYAEFKVQVFADESLIPDNMDDPDPLGDAEDLQDKIKKLVLRWARKHRGKVRVEVAG